MPIGNPEGALVPFVVADPQILQAGEPRCLYRLRLLRPGGDQPPLRAKLDFERGPADARYHVLFIRIDSARARHDLRNEEISAGLVGGQD